MLLAGRRRSPLQASHAGANVRHSRGAAGAPSGGSNMFGWIVLILFLAVLGYVVVAYNNLVRQRQLSQEGWSGIDVQLKRRADLIPNLLESVKGYMAHERETLEAVTNARAGAVAAGNGTPEQRAA
eukprot:gene1956-2638_t